MNGKPARGFVLGKFMPPHNGHVYMCDFARAYCDRLTILVCSLPGDPIPGELRFQWMREMFPDCDVHWCHEILPQEPADHPDFWPIWKDVIQRYGGQSDVVFASEAYGHRLAAETGARFVPVDSSRAAVPVSGTAIRVDPFAHWRHIPAAVRPYFVRKICVFGPESSGKSTLAVALASHFATVHVPEYGRIYTENFGVDVSAEDLRRIAAGHVASVAAARRQANRIVIEDTDPIMTAVWSRMLLGKAADLAAYDDTADLYLLCDIDMPWTDDGTRYFPSPGDRRRFFELCHDELARRGLDYVVISGDRERRMHSAVSAVAARLNIAG